MRIKWLHKLSVKLILVISGILLVNLAIYTYFTTSYLESDLIAAYSQNAYHISNVIKKSTHYSMLNNNRESVYHLIKTLGKENSVVRIRIYNNTGTIIFSTDSSEINHSVDKNAEACTACHAQTPAFKNVNVQDRIRVYTNADGKHVMGLINPIENEPECYSSSCHAHEASQKILGVLDVILSTHTIDAIINSNVESIVYHTMMVTVLISFFCGVFVVMIVNKPILEIKKGIEAVGKGNLQYKISLNSDDELGHLAARFNDMSTKLDTAYKEINDWSASLNQKVNEKANELKGIYDRVLQMEKLASLGKLSATVAHELNNPLEGILTYSKLIYKQLQKIQKDNEYESLLNYLSMISDESYRCGKIVKDMLIFSHRDEEAFILEDVHAIIRKSLALVHHHLEMKAIGLKEHYSASAPMISCNPHKIRQALLALFMNAVEAMMDGGTLSVTTTTSGQNISIQIQDTGLGINPRDLPHIFEPFYTTKSGGDGTGLGLAVVYGIIKHHKGSVILENTSQNGSTFKITLPLPLKTDY